MKKLLLILIMITSLAKAQDFECSGVYCDFADTSFFTRFYFFSYPVGHQEINVFRVKDTSGIFMYSIRPQFLTGKPNNMLWAGADGKIKVSSIDHLFKTYSGSTDASGDYTVIFPSSYTTVPFVKASIPNQSSPNQFVRVSSVSQTGFTINAYGFDSLGNALQIDTTPIQSLTISVFVAE
jgi:hypothetical protein